MHSSLEAHLHFESAGQFFTINFVMHASRHACLPQIHDVMMHASACGATSIDGAAAHPDPSRPHTHLQVVATLLTNLVLQRAVPLTCLARSAAQWPSYWLSIPRARAAGVAGQPIFGHPGRIEI